jgi:hypothetical protein
MKTVLNQALYDALLRRYRAVRINNQGVVGSRVRVYDPVLQRDATRTVQRGEYYAINCPHCNDTRFRCYVAYTFGTRTGGSVNTGDVYCYNEDCFQYPARRDDLLATVALAGYPQTVTLRVQDESPSPDVSVDLPDDFVLLSSLPASHPANAYMLSRGYDYRYLAERFGVGYCRSSSLRYASNRIIVPIVQNGEVKGYQSRYIGDIDRQLDPDTPKWWTARGTTKSQLLYNFDVAKRQPRVVVVEGPADVWAFGDQAVAPFGSTLSFMQRRLLASVCAGKDLVLLFDEDVEHNAIVAKSLRAAQDDLSMQVRRLFRVVLPAGKDPGDFEAGWLHAYVDAAIAAQERQVQHVSGD